MSGSSMLLAQGAKFSVNSDRGCAPFIVQVTDLSGVHDTIAVNYIWGDGTSEDTLETHSYSQAGVYSIIQTVANADPKQDTMEIEVFDLYTPEFHTMNCKNDVGSVFIEDNQFEAYEIDWGDGNNEIALAYSLVSHDYGFSGTFDVTVKGLINGAQTPGDFANLYCNSTTKKLYNTPTIVAAPPVLEDVTVINADQIYGNLSLTISASTPMDNYIVEIKGQNQADFTAVDTVYGGNPNYYIENLNTADNYYCVRVVAFDPCDGQRTPSNVLCSINLQATAMDQQNVVGWETETMDFSAFLLYKNGALLTTLSDPDQRQFIDNDVTCGTVYQYQLIENTTSGGQSTSDTISVTAISSATPDPIENISATVAGQTVELNWEAPTNFVAERYIISRSTDGIQYNVLDTIMASTYTDEGLFTQSTQYYYRINYLDACGNVSAASIIASPILLIKKPDQALSWSDYEGWTLGVNEYILEKYEANGQLMESLPLGSSTEYQEDLDSNPYQFISYKIIVIPNDGNIEPVESNILDVVYRSKVAFPNAFSPDGDGINDIFNFESRFIVGVRMKIYNRWGELVYQTTNIDQGWDGTVNGKSSPIGTYIHHTELTDDMGVTFVKTGEIVLLR